MIDLIGEIKTLILNNVVVQIRASKSNLKSIIKFSSSKFNEYKKNEVIDIILKYLDENDNNIIAERFISGTYTENKGYGTHYYFYKDDKQAFLIKKIKDEVEIFELIK